MKTGLPKFVKPSYDLAFSVQIQQQILQIHIMISSF